MKIEIQNLISELKSDNSKADPIIARNLKDGYNSLAYERSGRKEAFELVIERLDKILNECSSVAEVKEKSFVCLFSGREACRYQCAYCKQVNK